MKMKNYIIIVFCILALLSCEEKSSDFIDSLFFEGEQMKLNNETVKDFDGNVYHTVTIGEQTWMVENLRSSHYADGSLVKDIASAYGNQTNDATFGKLYTFQAAIRYDSIEGAQGICPEGWHVPTIDELRELIDYAKSKNEYVSFADQLCSTTGWTTKNGRNMLLFNAVPNGNYSELQYKYFGAISSFWTSSLSQNKGVLYYLSTDSAKYKSSFYYSSETTSAMGIRCIKNSSSIKLPTVVIDSVSKGSKRPKVYGRIVSSNEGTITKVGVCYATTVNTGMYDNVIVGVNNQNKFECELNELSTNSKYYIKAFARNELGTGYSPEKTYQTTSFAPTVSTINMTAVTANTATFDAIITDDGGSTITQSGFCWSTTQNPTILSSKVTNTTGNVNISNTITGLIGSTTYYIRAFATNSVGTTYSEQALFITLPTINIGSTSSITYKSAIISAIIPAQGNNKIIEYGICWGTNTNPTVQTFSMPGTNLTATNFSCALSNLLPSTKYYARAWAKNENYDINYSSEISFTTATIKVPVLTLNTSSNLTYKSATLSGSITTLGDAEINEYGFCYSSTNSTPTVSDKSMYSSNLSGSVFSSNISGLTQSTKYYYRAYAKTQYGTYYSSVGNITTPADPYTVSEGLLAYYNFDGQNVKDVLGNYNGVISGGVTFNTSVPNISGYAAQFDGTTGFINIPYQILPSSGSWSISLWIKTNKNGIGLFWFSGVYNYINISSASKLYFNPTKGAECKYSLDLSTNLLNNNWNLLTLIFDGTNVSYYVNSALFEKISNSTCALNNMTFSKIGVSLYDNMKFSGSMDNVRFYNRALTTTEISTLYTAKQ